uniref:Uncharacterized protein n=1 Tax=Ananas comosus var. bracteatus TaxID=296719 RepID=A0A6V7PTU9_ANACO|nr:unnamed protein product [Ananas comosus var. bracteatus]
MGGARRPPHLLLPLLLFVLILTPSAPRACALLVTQWSSLLSLSHSLLSRVANARAARGDVAGAARARAIADQLSLLGVGRGAWSLGRDFLWNYAFRGGGGAEASRTASRVLAALSEASRIKSTAEMRRWVLRNYPDLVALSNSFIQTLLRTFSRSGPLREAVLVLQREVEEGELLKDCLEVGARDLEGLLRIAKDLFFSYSSSSFDSDDL